MQSVVFFARPHLTQLLWMQCNDMISIVLVFVELYTCLYVYVYIYTVYLHDFTVWSMYCNGPH